MKTQKKILPSRSHTILDPGLGRMLLLSLAVHLLVVVLFFTGLIPLRQTPPREVYYVDLVNLPVKNPKAGRPEARVAQNKKPEEPPKKVAPEKPKVEKAPAKVVTKPTVAPKAAAKKAPEKKAETAKPVDESSVQSALDRLRLKQEIARMTQNDDRSADFSKAPVGMPTGKGTEAGPALEAWIHDYLKQAWSLSKYQVGRLDLEATVELQFDARGNLKNYRFIKASGDTRFDDSVKKAVLELKKLPMEPESPLDLPVVFNLKDLLE